MSSEETPVDAMIRAASVADWGQVVMNGGPPCFRLVDDKFCLRAKRWGGHDGDHAYMSLADLLIDLRGRTRRIEHLLRAEDNQRGTR